MESIVEGQAQKEERAPESSKEPTSTFSNQKSFSATQMGRGRQKNGGQLGLDGFQEH